MMTYKKILSFVLISFLHLFPLKAGQAAAIKAVVNTASITQKDVEDRLKLMLFVSGLPDTPEVRKELHSEALKSLIDESLQISEAQKFEIMPSDGEITDEIKSIEARNNKKPGDLKKELENKGIPFETFENQVRANLAWIFLIQQMYGPTVTVQKSEVIESLNRLKVSSQTPKRLVAEIFLPLDDPSKENELAATASYLLQQIQQGVPFPNVAQQFSKAASSSKGGDIGWIPVGHLESKLEEALNKMKPGEVSPPIKSNAGYHLLFLRDYQMDTGGTVTKLSLKQLHFPLSPLVSPQKAEEEALKLQETLKEIKSCKDLAAYKQEGVAIIDIPEVILDSLNPDLKEFLKDLPIQTLSPFARDNEGLTAFMMCSKELLPENIPTEEEMTSTLTNQRLNLLSQRKLRDLKRSAFIDIRP